jgi:hypothetical protein
VSGDYVLLIGSFDANDGVHTRLLRSTLGVPVKKFEVLGGLSADVADVGPVDMSDLVSAAFRIGIMGADTDEVLAIVAELQSELEALAEIVYGVKGATGTVRLVPKVADCIEIPLEPPYDVELASDAKTIVDVAILREPYLLTPAETLHDEAGLDTPGVLSLAAMTTRYPAPLTTELTAPASNLARVVMGVYPEAAAIGAFLFTAQDLAWTGGEAAADANGYPDGVGDTLWRANDGTAYADIDDTHLRLQDYLAIANVKATAAGTGHISVGNLQADIPTTGLDWLLSGTLALPDDVVRGSASSALRLVIWGDDPASYAYFNWLLLVPAPAYLWMKQTGSVAAHRVENGLTYLDDVVNLADVLTESRLKAKGGTLVLGARAETAAPMRHVHLTAAATPRHAQFPA